jgi:HlyD family secretion protein
METPTQTPPRLPVVLRNSLTRVAKAAPLQKLAIRLRSLRPAQRLWIGAAGLLVLLLAWLAWPRAQTVDVAVIDRGIVRSELTDEGRTRIHDVYVVSAPVGGVLQRLTLEPGDTVTRGQVIGSIAPADPALLDARVSAEASATVAAAEASLRAAEADLELKRLDHQRVTQLASRDFASPAAVDAAQAALNAARANVSARRAEVQRARAAAGGGSARARTVTPVRSPSSGRVLQLLQESEAVVPAGAAIMEIGDPADLEVVAEFLSEDAVRMRPGAMAYIEAWGGEAAIPARISRIEPYAHTKVSALGVEEQRVNVILRLDDPASAPPLGHAFRVDARVVLSEAAGVVRVPVDALIRDGERWSVFRVVNGRARLTPVEVGEGGGQYREVTRGLAAGDRVVVFPSEALSDGDRVRNSRR